MCKVLHWPWYNWEKRHTLKENKKIWIKSTCSLEKLQRPQEKITLKTEYN